MNFRRDGFLLPALGLALMHLSVCMGAFIGHLRHAAGTSLMQLALLHLLVLFLVALALSFAAQKGLRQPRLRFIFLGLIGCAFVVIPFLPFDVRIQIFNGRPPVIGPGMGLLIPVALTMFFRAAPAGWEGFSFGLIMACGELLWALFFPLLGAESAQGPGNLQLSHFLALTCWLSGGAGLCLAAALPASGEPGSPVSPQARGGKGKRGALLLIFAAGAGVFVLKSLHLGAFPKVSLEPELVGLPHYLLVALLPLAGRILDSAAPGRLLAWLIPAVLLIPPFALVRTHGGIDLMPLFSLLNVLGQVLLLAIFTASARLMKSSAVLPLLLILANSLYLFHICGVALRNRVEALPYGAVVASLPLVVGVVLCLWRFRRILLENPGLWEFPPQDAPGREAGRQTPGEENLKKISSFAAAHSLTARERDILLGLLRGASRIDMERELGLASRTVRYHLAALLKKTAMPNEGSFLDYYQSWKS
jgi:DNA-binding CsgD family transcriptional regulator